MKTTLVPFTTIRIPHARRNLAGPYIRRARLLGLHPPRFADSRVCRHGERHFHPWRRRSVVDTITHVRHGHRRSQVPQVGWGLRQRRHTFEHGVGELGQHRIMFSLRRTHSHFAMVCFPRTSLDFEFMSEFEVKPGFTKNGAAAYCWLVPPTHAHRSPWRAMHQPNERSRGAPGRGVHLGYCQARVRQCACLGCHDVRPFVHLEFDLWKHTRACSSQALGLCASTSAPRYS
jgi:hypothetical protein